MKTSLACAIALCAAALVAGAQEYPKYVTGKKLYANNDLRGKRAPDFVVEQWLTAQPKTKGKVVIIDFWATWCGPCRGLIPELNAFQAKFKKDVVVIGVSDEPAATVKQFMAKTKMEYSVAIDTKKRMDSVLGVQGIPHVMVITPDGIVRWQGFSGSKEDPLTEAVISQIIAASKHSR